MNEPGQLLRSPDDMPAEQVAWWFPRMHEQDCSAAERRAFESWLAASEVYRREYRQYVQLWYHPDHPDQEPKRSPQKPRYRAG